MRQIKFRAWSGLVSDTEPKMMYWEPVWGGKRPDDRFSLDNWASGEHGVMQCTGLLDKKGKEIYEGDIIRYMSNSKGFQNAEVFWDKGGHLGYSMRSFGIIMELPREPKEREIVGNIYEAPELLK